jgi:DEAD/DEAH box helicase domain-containing protein
MDVSGFLRQLTSLPEYNGQIVHDETILPRDPSFGELDQPLSEELQACLEKHHLFPFYTHQADSINRAREGKNVIIVTSSASGKSLCYNTVVIQTLLTVPFSRALYLFPTKALAQDQLRALRELFQPELLRYQDLATFDGDTPAKERGDIRKKARIILTNPDMLHLSLLPNHAMWSRFLRHLKYVIVDEAHTYRGIFGSHIADVLRRLRRLCRIYGANPQFILSSATISNPGELAEKLTGLSFKIVDNDGSPHGMKDFIFWNPPIIDETKRVRRSPNSEATFLFTGLVSQGVRSLVFTRTRRLTELIYLYSKRKLGETGAALARRIQPYRAGYLPAERRRIEKELFSGKLLGVVATTALEMGIDIGDLDATILTGYPGSIASTWQQAGRSGRSKEESLSFLIGLDNPLDQYFMRHPEAFFKKGYENALVNPENKYILRAHIVCAAWEQPLTGDDVTFFGNGYERERDELVAQGVLREHNGRWFLAPSIAYPAQGINIRSASNLNYAIIDSSTNTIMETIEDNVALYQVYPGAIYLHQGETFLISKLDLTNHIAYAEPSDVNYYTQTKELTDIKIINVFQNKKMGDVEIKLGEVEVTTSIIGYKKKVQYTEEVIGEELLDLPPYHFQTVALWFDLPEKAVAELEEKELDFPGGLHATEHAAIGILPLFALCDRNDIGGVSTPFHPDTGTAQVFIYDGYPGGIGIAEKGFELIDKLWDATLNVITECPCQDGCPSCIQSPKCGNNNKPLDKKAAKILLEGLVGLR